MPPKQQTDQNDPKKQQTKQTKDRRTMFRGIQLNSALVKSNLSTLNYSMPKDTFMFNSPDYKYSRSLALTVTHEIALVEGMNRDESSGWNTVLEKIYCELIALNTGTFKPTKAQVAEYIHNIRGLQAIVTIAAKAYNVALTTDTYNTRFSQVALRGLGVKEEEIQNNLGNLKANIEAWCARLNSIAFPSMPIWKLQHDLFSTFYATSNGTMKTYHQFSLPCITKNDSLGKANFLFIPSTAAGPGDYTSIWPFADSFKHESSSTYAHMVEQINNAFNAFAADPVFKEIAGKITRAYNTVDVGSWIITDLGKAKFVNDSKMLAALKSLTLSQISLSAETTSKNENIIPYMSYYFDNINGPVMEIKGELDGTTFKRHAQILEDNMFYNFVYKEGGATEYDATLFTAQFEFYITEGADSNDIISLRYGGPFIPMRTRMQLLAKEKNIDVEERGIESRDVARCFAKDIGIDEDAYNWYVLVCDNYCTATCDPGMPIMWLGAAQNDEENKVYRIATGGLPHLSDGSYAAIDGQTLDAYHTVRYMELFNVAIR